MTYGRPQQEISIADLLSLWRELKRAPILVAVWCVDRPDAVWRMRALADGTATTPYTSALVEGVPVYEWYSRYASAEGRMMEAEDWASRPECFRTPGVYMQMSDGEYRKVDL